MWKGWVSNYDDIVEIGRREIPKDEAAAVGRTTLLLLCLTPRLKRPSQHAAATRPFAGREQGNSSLQSRDAWWHVHSSCISFRSCGAWHQRPVSKMSPYEGEAINEHDGAQEIQSRIPRILRFSVSITERRDLLDADAVCRCNATLLWA